MSDVEMMKEELQVKSQQLDEKEQETILLKEEIERMKRELIKFSWGDIRQVLCCYVGYYTKCGQESEVHLRSCSRYCNKAVNLIQQPCSVF